MKKIYIVLFTLLATGMTLTSCSDKLMQELNTDETKAAYIDPNAQLTTALLQTYGDFQTMDTYRNYICGFTQQFAGGWNVTNFAGCNNYDDTIESLWNKFYNVGIKNLVDAIYNTEDKPNVNAALRITKVYMLSILTDAYGDVPCSEAGLGYIGGIANPKYDTQEEIYDYFFEELADCVEQLGTGTDRISGDVTNLGGSIEGWKRFANSLRMRYAMRISDVKPEKAKAEFEKALTANGGYITNADQDAFVKYIDVPFTLYDGAKDLDFRANAFSETNYGQDYSSPAIICATLFNLMRDNNDPRTYRITRHYDNLKRGNTKPDEWTIDLTDEYMAYLQKYGKEDYACEIGHSWYAPWPTNIPEVGQIPTLEDFPTVAALAEQYPTAGFFATGINDNARLIFPWLSIEFERPNCPGFLISCAEVHFLLAEAKSKGWAVPGSIKEHYEEGIKEAMQMLNTHYLPATQKISDAEISDYITSIEANDPLGTNAREAINTQAYILHVMNPSEAWANLRRADYPVLRDRTKMEKLSDFTYPDPDLSTPDRLLYPVLEERYNKARYQEAIDRMGGKDDWHQRVWWDVKHGNFE